jgi:hypothetical protein
MLSMRAFWVVSIILTIKTIDPHSVADSKKLHWLSNENRTTAENSIESFVCDSRIESRELCHNNSVDKSRQSHEIIANAWIESRLWSKEVVEMLLKTIGESQQRKPNQLDSLLSPPSTASCGRKASKKATEEETAEPFAHRFSPSVHSDLFLAPLEAATESFQV